MDGRSSLQRPLSRGDKTVSLSAFSSLFAEVVSYYQGRVTSMSDLETRLEAAGQGVGARFLELVAFREKPGRRETTVVGMLTFVTGPAWQSLFGKSADALEKSTEQAHTYQIREDAPITNLFISMPKDYSRVNVAAYVAGIIRGMMEAASFPCTVKAVTVPAAAGAPLDKTVFVITLVSGSSPQPPMDSIPAPFAACKHSQFPPPSLPLPPPHTHSAGPPCSCAGGVELLGGGREKKFSLLVQTSGKVSLSKSLRPLFSRPAP
jgi:hypothetical protein